MENSFCEVIKTLRLGSSMTQKQVAEKIGVLPQTYQSYEVGTITPSLERFIDLAELFDVSLDYLIGRKEY